MSKSVDKIILNKKRNRTLSLDENDKNIDTTKKIKSSETQKTQIKNIAFMAHIDNDYKNENVMNEKLKGDDLIIESRKEKAIKEIKSAKENNNDEFEKIKESLKYDNTNKYTIYRLLKYYKSKNDQDKFDKAIRLYKFCITKKIKIKEGKKVVTVDLNNLYTIKEPMEELEELDKCKKEEHNVKDIRNSLISIYSYYYHICSYFTNLRKILNSNDLNEIISIKYEIKVNDNSSYELKYEEDKKRQILSKYKTIKKEDIDYLLSNIYNFLHRYSFIKGFTYFRLNQPISYEHNLTLYYNYIIYSLYELTIDVDESQNKIIFKLPQLIIYNRIRAYHNLLFDNFFDAKEPMNKTMGFLLQFLLLLLSVDDKHNWGRKFRKLIHPQKTDTFLKKSSENDFFGHLKEDYSEITAKTNDDIMQLFYENDPFQDIIEIKLENMWSNIFDNFQPINWIWEGLKFEEFQNTNFFTKKDIKYLRYLIKIILSSELFENIFNHFSDIDSVADYYFKDPKNIEDYINRIIFLPFNRKDINKLAITDRRILSILISGFPDRDIDDIDVYIIYRILELSLRVIALGCHEPSHFIKAVYSLITEGKISRYTSNSDKNNEGGFFLEEVLFGWVVNEKKPLDLSDLLKKDIICKNEAIKNKKIDLITALTLLNPDIYKKDLEHFRKQIFGVTKKDLKTFKISSTDSTYKEYINSIIDVKAINAMDVKKLDYSINASMSFENGYYIEYISTNHNL